MAMDLKWFLKYLTLHRWSKFLSVTFAFAFCVILAFYFFGEQKKYKQTEWKFKSTSMISHGLILEPNTIYKITWEDEDVSYPTSIEINGVSAHTLNYYKLPYARSVFRNYCNIQLTNPCYLRVNKKTDFKLTFIIYNQLKWNSGFKEFFKSWFKSFSDPVEDANWMVEDVTDDNDNHKFLVDGNFPIFQIQK